MINAKARAAIQQSFYSGNSTLIDTPIDEIKRILNKHQLVLYAPFYINGKDNVPFKYAFCDITQETTEKISYRDKQDNKKLLRKYRSMLDKPLDLNTKNEILMAIYDYNMYQHSFYYKQERINNAYNAYRRIYKRVPKT